MVLYKCDKCLKEFNKKHNYEVHINRKFSCINNYIDKDLIIQNLTDENIELEQKNKELEIKIKKLDEKNIILNELYKSLLDKCLDKTIKNISNNNCNNTNNYNDITNNTINNINVKLVPFGMENLDDLTQEEKKIILNAGMFCSVMCTKKLNCNPRLPQYQNIAFTNLRSNDAKIFDKDKTWKTVDKEDLFETVIPRRIDDVNLLIENEDILAAEAARQHQREDAEAPPGADDIKITPYMENLLKKGIEEDVVIKDEIVKKRFHRTVYDFNQNKKTITK
jgi:hypothetical protein